MKKRLREHWFSQAFLNYYFSVSCLTLWLSPVAAQSDTMPTAAAC